ncbi:hypothetical protein BGZ95_003982 [Linnemannia exigua]|uniref:F-box domain-containing protein n=1 Tax=Linnemannia exigua TaxID=604196 RepID=A0AAD4DHS5_9FUNG|nr:hypothetical protein BGZ95_003982 [Linnemannia exigua]
MKMILDLPDEIYVLIAENLNTRVIYSCVRVCRSFYSSFIPRLWSDLSIKQYRHDDAIDPAIVRTNAHRVESVNYSSTLVEEYYTIIYPRLHTIRLDTLRTDEREPTYLQVTPPQKVQFARHHPTIRKLTSYHKDTLPKEFWEVVETEWKELESLEMSGVVDADAVNTFWRVCDRLQNLYFSDLNLPETLPDLSTLSFRRLRNLKVIKKYHWPKNLSHQLWPVQLLEQVKRSDKLRRLSWDVDGLAFPARMVLEALEEGYWEELCEFSIGDKCCSDQNLAAILGALTSRRLTCFELMSGKLGPLTYRCLQGRYFGHLRDLTIARCGGVTSAMVQEIMVGCVHLVGLDAPHIFVQDIVRATKPWGCLRLQSLVVYIAKQAGDEPGWDGQVFEQISKLRRLHILDVQRDPHYSYLDEETRPDGIMTLETLDYRLNRGAVEKDIRCWSSLVQLREFSFDGDRQTLGMDELVWMAEHWRDLWCVTGGFRGIQGDDNCAKRDRIVRQAGIWVYD